MTRQVLFLDFDGVLHRGNSYLTPEGIVSSAPGRIELFEYAGILAQLLEPYPLVEVILSTDWVPKLGFEQARDALPIEHLRHRVCGSTFDSNADDVPNWLEMPRGWQVLQYVLRHGLTNWLALDDRRDGFESCRARLVDCQTMAGLGDVAVQGRLSQQCQKYFAGTA
ncbi:HAD domain-containing protein [Ralstonia solanacearum]|uniref:HAD domain-containing protein n=1 Tax=Ralstonia solanacearum TaxID=305 RepID=UPI00078DDAD5|nr:HAD domain-containing protein [Ralstonia solanacearum]AMP38847.1 hydrolase [Ralstonia solanacearum]AXV87675.1 hydrolase [Ralstonia solanacearum]AXW07138.1 hydrolase [Ralstonia solanacearum]AXW24920.1 hydrolase [Ralstonia solanacearum]AXW81833.1 hydrolase [Ralstonia solanacearum]